MTILEALDDDKLFRPFFKQRASWLRWRVFLATLFGLPTTEEEQAIYQHHTGRETVPIERSREVWVIVGRRGGKSRIAALIATYLAAFIDYLPFLVPGEMATIPIVAVDKKQARQIFRYISAFFEHIPMLKKMVVRRVQGHTWELELSNKVQIEIHTGSFRSTRGYTIASFIGDEIAFWQTDDDSANPDSEILKSVRPGMLTIPHALLLNLSSPYARQGELWRAYDRHFGKDTPGVLVWQGTTEEMHPTVNKQLIQEAYDEDEASATAEYGAEFRKDIEAFVSREVLEQVVIPGRHELPYCDRFRYHAFTDPSGGSQDSFTLAIAHSEKNLVVVDVVREIKPPFSPEHAVQEFCTLIKAYRITSVTGDRYAGSWVQEPFRKNGIHYTTAERPKSDLYRDSLPLLNSGRAEILDHPRLKAQLLALERRTGRGGKGTIDHPPRGHDDVANAVAGVLVAETLGPTPPVIVRYRA